MDKALALKICSDFRPVEVEGGKVKCFFYNGEGLCKRPEYFRCELVLHREEEEKKGLTTISVSRVNTILRCPRLYALQYVYHAEAPIPAKWKVVGRAFSDARAKIDCGLPYELKGEINSMQVDKARLSAVLRRYAEQHKPELTGMNEVRVFFPYKDIHFYDFIDVLTRDRETVIGWIYNAMTYDEIKVLQRAAVRLHGIPEAKQFVLAVAKKPAQKLLKAKKVTKKESESKAETPFEMEKRVYDELGKKTDLFTYTYYDRAFFDIPAVLEQIYRASTLVKAFEAANWPPALSMNCDNCDFRPYCLKHMTEIGCSRKFCSHPAICDTVQKALPAPKNFLDKPIESSTKKLTDGIHNVEAQTIRI